MKIGVFDSGVGGKSVANALKRSLPDHEIVYAYDKQNLPYGTKTKAQLISFVTPILNRLVDDGCKMIVIACNTVTTNIITELRTNISIPLIGVEPMVGPAAKMTKSGVITVCATPATLSSDRYRYLKAGLVDTRIVEPDCSDWAQMIEDDDVDEQKIRHIVNDSLAQHSDVFVMGCTHYHWIEDIIDEMTAGRAVVIQPEQAVVEQVRRVIAEIELPS